MLIKRNNSERNIRKLFQNLKIIEINKILTSVYFGFRELKSIFLSKYVKV